MCRTNCSREISLEMAEIPTKAVSRCGGISLASEPVGRLYVVDKRLFL